MLPQKDFQFLLPHLTSVQHAQGDVLFEAGSEVDQVYFPLSGMVSIVVVMRDGKAVETAHNRSCGRHRSHVWARPPHHASPPHRPTSDVRKQDKRNGPQEDRWPAAGPSPTFAFAPTKRCSHKTRLTAACNALHQVEARLCRWLLQTRDRWESDTLRTHSGIPRRDASRQAHLGHRGCPARCRPIGAISYSRGVIKIVGLDALAKS